MVRQRHPPSGLTRETHTTSPVDYTHPSDVLYGSEVDVEPITGIDIGAGSINDGHIVDGGLDGSTAIKPGTLPGGVDVAPPPTPSIYNARPDFEQDDDGESVGVILFNLGYDSPPVDLDDLSYYLLESTRFPKPGPLPGDPPVADWTKATQWLVMAVDPLTGDPDVHGEFLSPGVQPNALIGGHYWMRAYAVDISGNRQEEPSVVVEVTVDGDLDGPPQIDPLTVVVKSGHETFALAWPPVLADDFAYTEVRWSPTGLASWSNIRVTGTIVVVAGVENEVVLDVQVRTVDTSGNTSDSSGTDYVVADYPDDGWVSLGTVMPSALLPDELHGGEEWFNSLLATSINADMLRTGVLRVGDPPPLSVPPPTPSPDVSIEIWHSYVEGGGTKYRLVGAWSAASGILMVDRDPKVPYRMVIDEAGLTIYDDTDAAHPLTRVRIDPLGIDAASITFGDARGGHNLVLNSSFELGGFGGSVVVDHLWTVAADWAATRQPTDVNISQGTDSFTMSAL